MKEITLILLLFPFLLFSQEKGTFVIEAQANYETFKLTDFNSLIGSTTFGGSKSHDNVSINNGMDYELGFSYTVSPFFDIGIYGAFQNGSAEQKVYYDIVDEGNPYGGRLLAIDLIDYKIQSYTLGLSSHFILNNFPFWKSTPWLSKIESKIGLQLGYGRALYINESKIISSVYLEADYSYISTDVEVINNGLELFQNVYTSNVLQINSSLKIGYILTNKHYFSSIGLKIGYQYFVSDALSYKIKNQKTPPFYEKETKLDLSGLLLGIYLTFGR